MLLLSACSTVQLYFLVIFHESDVVQGFDKCFEACVPGGRFPEVTAGCSGKGSPSQRGLGGCSGCELAAWGCSRA